MFLENVFVGLRRERERGRLGGEFDLGRNGFRRRLGRCVGCDERFVQGRSFLFHLRRFRFVTTVMSNAGLEPSVGMISDVGGVGPRMCDLKMFQAGHLIVPGSYAVANFVDVRGSDAELGESSAK